MGQNLCPEHGVERQKNGVCPKCYFREWYARNKASVVARAKARKRVHREETLADKRRWLRKKRMWLHGEKLGDYTEAQVYQRHGWNCYICGGAIDPTVADRGSRHPSFDHVVPISRGGLDTLDNVRPCHKGCNSRKGRRLLHELPAA